MNINVWIIKICKALKQFFWIGFLLMNLSMEVLQPPFLLPQLMQGKKCLLPAVLIYRHVLKGSSKCSFRIRESTALYLHFSCSSWFFNTTLLYSIANLSYTQLRLDSNLHPHSVVFGMLFRREKEDGRDAHWNSLEVHTLSASRGDVETGDHHEMGLAEVDTVFQTLGHTFQGLQVFQRIQLKHLLQINCEKENTQIGKADKTQVWLVGETELIQVFKPISTVDNIISGLPSSLKVAFSVYWPLKRHISLPKNTVRIALAAFLSNMLCHPLQNCRCLLPRSNTLKQTGNAKRVLALSHILLTRKRFK